MADQPTGVETTHADYQSRDDEWRTLRDVLGGSRAVKAAGQRYLPALSGQTQIVQPGTGATAYDTYKTRAKFYAMTARTKEALVGTIFHKDLVIEAPADVVEQIADVTLNDTPIEDFAVQALDEVIGMGRYGILVDMPDSERPNEPRPYWVGYRTEQMVNWRTTSKNGDTYLTMMVLKETYEVVVNEFLTKSYEQYRVLKLSPHKLAAIEDDGLAYVQEIYQKARETDKTFVIVKEIVPMKWGKPLGFIPFLVIGPTTLSPCPEKPPLSEMAETNLHMYRRSADLEWGRHFTGLPTPVVIGMPPPTPGTIQAPMVIGSSHAWMLPPNADAKYLEFTGQGLSALVEGMKEDKEEMAQLGAELFAADPQSREETLGAVRIRHSAKTASLKTIARRLGAGLSKCLRWHAWWLGAAAVPNDLTIIAKMNTDFIDTKITPEELKAWVLTLQAGGCSYATFYEQLEKGELTRPGVTAEQEKAAIDAEAPEPVVEPDPMEDEPLPKERNSVAA